ncbi:MAG: enoyl-CoA hydratase/isomerase family protein [Pseudomonadales bacterium]|jgi:enoyl-CoA hydratase/carnithine racemase|nr:enoyl-CoA hydratase/isomerase family protein [Pseudomonadales bacterium]MDP6471004.1 enoyl-CoA hydratase/isomerase family protein [Pseudomonadales bacterium]MDP6825811.1 enoyl-CoA hydratase/isomerase family protein [Pseudomonadales bacterium]MDP6970196.1 enoyl-CoA hydratase/isomerase family protein [Pseudomonadales bacterium]|tara:strand:- start:2743 stop:3528 length:786 start_codon:yes stop_codon:yes gene_type:complete
MKHGDVEVNHPVEHVALVEIQRGPNNFFDEDLINDLGDAFEALDQDIETRALVLASEGKHFCAGANFSNRSEQSQRSARTQTGGNPLYTAAVRLFACKKPVIAAIQGAAVGGGFGLAVMPDFRVVCPEARFTANFVKLGFHPGFGLTYTLDKLIGPQKANLMFMTGRRIDGATAHEWGLADFLTDKEDLRDEAIRFAAEIAENAPLAVQSVRATMRAGIADAVKAQTDHEFIEQHRLQQTEDHKEGVRAVAERRPGNFKGH